MKLYFNKRSPILTVLLLTELCFIIYIAFQLTKPVYKPTPSLPSIFSQNVEKKTWKLYMQSVGSQKAYADFKKTYVSASFYLQHSAIHLIGENLYELEGLKGIDICDDAFLNGCYHGFIAAIVKEKGLKGIANLDTFCESRPGKYCHHGIGHGLLSYLGDNKMTIALKTCDSLQVKKSSVACFTGVFMEHNMNILSSPKIKEQSDPFYPCSSLSEKYQYTCYFQQIALWNSIYNKNYSKMGSLCNELEGDNKKYCFSGLGLLASESSSFDIGKTTKKCDQMPNEETNMLCRKNAKSFYERYTSQKVISKRINELCKLESTSLTKACLEK